MNRYQLSILIIEINTFLLVAQIISNSIIAKKMAVIQSIITASIPLSYEKMQFLEIN